MKASIQVVALDFGPVIGVLVERELRVGAVFCGGGLSLMFVEVEVEELARIALGVNKLRPLAMSFGSRFRNRFLVVRYAS